MMVEKAIELRMFAFTDAVDKAWKGQPDIVVGPTPSGGSESTAQIKTAAQGKMQKPAETAPPAEWAAWEAQQEVAKSEAEAGRATRGPKKRAGAPQKPADDAPEAEKEAWQKRCAKLERRRTQRDK